MDFKVKITCLACGCSFELRPSDKMNLPDVISCPNCGQEVPKSIADHLKSGLSELALIPFKVSDSEDSILTKQGFHFDVKETPLLG